MTKTQMCAQFQAEGQCCTGWLVAVEDIEKAAVTINQLRAELEQWTTWGVIEVAIRNPSVSEYMRHWEGRATKAEAEVERLRAELERRTAAVIVSENGQALACSASVAAAYGTLREEVERLQAELRSVGAVIAALRAELADASTQIQHYVGRVNEMRAERDALARRLHEIAEEWAGAECGEPVHAQEAYAIALAKRMYTIAVEGRKP